MNETSPCFQVNTLSEYFITFVIVLVTACLVLQGKLLSLRAF